MGLFSKPIKNLDDLFVHMLQDMYYAEQQASKNLPTLIEKAQSTALKQAFQKHLNDTDGQIKRLEQVFKLHGHAAKGVTCAAMDGIITETKEIISDCADPEVCDAAMIAAGQAVEHYEITRYGTMVAFAEELGRADCAALLKETLEEEKAADAVLSGIAESRVNRQAA